VIDIATAVPPDLRQLAGLVIKNQAFPHIATSLDVTALARLQQELGVALEAPQADLRNIAALLVARLVSGFTPSIWVSTVLQCAHKLDGVSGAAAAVAAEAAADAAASGAGPLSTAAMSAAVAASGSLSNADKTAFFAADGCLTALRRVCEDSAERLFMETENRSLDYIVPRLLSLFRCAESSIRLRAVESINSLLYLMPGTNHGEEKTGGDGSSSSGSSSSSSSSSGGGKNALVGAGALALHLQGFLEGLALLSSDADPRIRRAVCTGVNSLAINGLALLGPLLDGICGFMAAAVGDSDEGVALEACEFWVVLMQLDEGIDVMRPRLAAVLPALWSQLTLTPAQRESDRQRELLEATGEKRFTFLHYKAKQEEDEEKEAEAMWTVRKQAASTLDTAAVTFPGNEVCPILLPLIQDAAAGGSDDANSSRFGHGDDAAPASVWEAERALLALGSMSHGCYDFLVPHLADLFLNLFLPALSHAVPELRAISAWTMSRYCDYCCEAGSLDQPIFTLSRLLVEDASPKVQAAAASSLCAFAEAAGPGLQPFLETILPAIEAAFERVGVRNRFILCDLVGTVVEASGEMACGPKAAPLYLPYVVRLLLQLEDSDYYLFPVMECLASVIPLAGAQFEPYTAATLTKVVSVADSTLRQMREDPDDCPGPDFIVCSLDVVAALVCCYADQLGAPLSGALAGDFPSTPLPDGAPLAFNGQPMAPLLSILATELLNNPDSDVRQAALALTGDLARTEMGLLHPRLGLVVTRAIETLHRPMGGGAAGREAGCFNNACWVLGEVALAAGGDGNGIGPYIGRVVEAVAAVAAAREATLTLKHNTAITFGRLALVCTEQVSGTIKISLWNITR
jgi:transportin-1